MSCRGLLTVVLTVLVAVAAGCASAESSVQKGYDFSKVDKVAILDVSGHVTGQAAKDIICNYLGMQFMNKGYVLVEREKIQAVLKEQEFQRSPVTTNEGAARAGQILNVPAVVIGAVNVNGERITITAKMIDVEKGNVTWISVAYGKTGRTLTTIAAAAVGAAAGVAVGGNRAGKTVGGVAGGVVGAAVGDALAADVDSVVRKVIRKIGAKIPTP